MTFKDFNLKEALNKAIDEAGFMEPSPVQKEAIPLVLQGSDIIAQAQTGTGKTAAFGLPILNMMSTDGGVEALVIVPTRELAMQVSDELYKFGKLSGIKTATVYGGSSYDKQIERVREANIIVATPGRLQDLLRGKRIKIAPRFVVLDEADEMLDMGFFDEISSIFEFLPKQRQTLMFSATMPPAIRKLAENILNNPKTVAITKSESSNSLITQNYYVVEEKERDDALVRLIDYKNPTKCIIFCRMKKEVDRLATHLISQGFKVGVLHGDMEQKQREIAIRAFKGGGVDIFVATDVAARGLDVNDVSHVFNYHLPFDSESYVHRIGRTGRGGKSGIAITLVTPNELRALKRIEKDIGAKMITKQVPNKSEVVANKQDSLIEEITNAQIGESGIELVKKLTHSMDMVTIAQLLATILTSKNQTRGKDSIGFGIAEVNAMIDNSNRRETDDKRRGNRGRRRQPQQNSNRNSSRGNNRNNSRKRDSGGHKKSN